MAKCSNEPLPHKQCSHNSWEPGHGLRSALWAEGMIELLLIVYTHFLAQR